jgi:hypothetical protein
MTFGWSHRDSDEYVAVCRLESMTVKPGLFSLASSHEYDLMRI